MKQALDLLRVNKRYPFDSNAITDSRTHDFCETAVMMVNEGYAVMYVPEAWVTHLSELNLLEQTIRKVLNAQELAVYNGESYKDFLVTIAIRGDGVRFHVQPVA